MSGKRKSGLWIAAAFGAWLVLVWLYTAARMVRFGRYAGRYDSLLMALTVLVLLVIFWNGFWYLLEQITDSDSEEDENRYAELYACEPADTYNGDRVEANDDFDEEDWPEDDFDGAYTMLFSGLLLGVLTIFFLLAAVFDLRIQSAVFSDPDEIELGILSISRQKLFDPVLVLIFPFWTQKIMQSMRASDCCWEAVSGGCLQLVILTVMSCLLFQPLGPVWLLTLAVIESLTIAAGTKIIFWDSVKGRGNLVMAVGFYILAWAGLLFLGYTTGISVSDYLYSGSWSEYQERVREFLSNIAFFGHSAALETTQQLEFLQDSGDYLFGVLYSFGWAGGAVTLGILLCFLAGTWQMFGTSAAYNRNYLVCHAAWWNLAMRVICAIPRDLGLLPVPIRPPFSGTLAIEMDTLAFGILVCFWLKDRSEKAAPSRPAQTGRTGGLRQFLRENRLLAAGLAAAAVILFFLAWGFGLTVFVNHVTPVTELLKEGGWA